MNIDNTLTDQAVLSELGARLLKVRLERNLTQAALAEQAGVSKRTVERIESGEVATQLSGFVRICRALGLLERFNVLIPETSISPLAQLKAQRPKRRRASAKQPAGDAAKASKWTWGE